jgi:hypothetical protein
MRPIPSNYPEVHDMQLLFAKMGKLLSSRAKKEYCLAVVRSIYGLNDAVSDELYDKRLRDAGRIKVSVLINPVRRTLYETPFTLIIHMDNQGRLEEWYNGTTEKLRELGLGRILGSQGREPTGDPKLQLRSVMAPRRYLRNGGRVDFIRRDGVNASPSNASSAGSNGDSGGGGRDGGDGGTGNSQDGDGPGRGGLLEVLQHPVLFSISPSAYNALLGST